jgi:hypothetical protein
MIDTMHVAKAYAATRLLPEGTRTRTNVAACPSVLGSSVPAAADDATFVDTSAWSPPV